MKIYLQKKVIKYQITENVCLPKMYKVEKNIM